MKQIKLTIALCLLLLNVATAQTLQMPFTPDVKWYGGGELFNTAMIAYGPGSTDMIYASAFNGGAIIVTDANFGPPSTITTPTPLYLPDVAFGNIAGGSPNFILAVAHPGPMQIIIDRYKVTTGPTISVPMAPIIIPTASQPGRVHIDAIAPAGTSSASGFPDCDEFVVTWDEASGLVWASLGSMNVPSYSTPWPVGFGTEPDVAAVQRNSGPGGSVVDFGLITWVDAGNILMYAEVDYTTPSSPVVSSSVLDMGGITLMAHPRIDGIDDYNANAIPGIAQYKVVAEVVPASSGVSEVRTYDNLMGPGTWWTSSNVVAPGALTPPGPYNHYVPVVALSNVRQAQNWVVAHLTDFGPLQNSVFMEPIDLFVPNALSNLPYFNTYYWVNSSLMADLFTWDLAHTYAGALSIASPVNMNSNMYNAPTLYAWVENVGGWWQTNHKLVGGSYAFKGGATAVRSTNKDGMEIYPNPATSTLTLSAPAGGATNYEIIDVAGRIVSEGTMLQRTQNIDVSEFTPGSYIIKMFKDGASTSCLRFAKQ